MAFGLTRFGSAPESVAAAGSAIGDAAAISGPLSIVTGGSGTNGAQLPDLPVGEMIAVQADGGAVLLYPHSATGTVNGGSAGAAVTVANGETAILVRYSDTDWRGGVAVGF